MNKILLLVESIKELQFVRPGYLKWESQINKKNKKIKRRRKGKKIIN